MASFYGVYEEVVILIAVKGLFKMNQLKGVVRVGRRLIYGVISLSLKKSLKFINKKRR